MKKTIKRVTAWLLSVAMMITLLPQISLTKVKADVGFPITLDVAGKTDKLAIVGVEAMDTLAHIVIAEDGTITTTGTGMLVIPNNVTGAAALLKGKKAPVSITDKAVAKITLDDQGNLTIPLVEGGFTGYAIAEQYGGTFNWTGKVSVDSSGAATITLQTDFGQDLHEVLKGSFDFATFSLTKEQTDALVTALSPDKPAGPQEPEVKPAGDLVYTSADYIQNGTYYGKGQLGFKADQTLDMAGTLKFGDATEFFWFESHASGMKWTIENDELVVDTQGVNINLGSEEIGMMDAISAPALVLVEKDGENTVVKVGFANDDGSPNTPYVFTLTPSDMEAIKALLPQPTKYAVSIDGTTVAQVEEGASYVLPTEAKYGYYVDGELYKAGATVENITADVAFTSINELSVSMAAGAGIKASTPAGIRWQARVNSDNMDAVASETAIKAGMLISANDLVENAGTLDKASTYATKDITNSGWYKNEAGTYCAAIVGINEENYTRDFVARAYVTVTYNDGTAETYYSEMGAVRSVETIAKAVVADNYRGLTDAEKTVVDSFIK